MLQERARHVSLEMEGRRDVLSEDRAHAIGGRDDVLGRRRVAISEAVSVDALAVAGQLQDVVQQMRADVHEAIAAVVSLSAGHDVTQLADFPRTKSRSHSLHLDA